MHPIMDTTNNVCNSVLLAGSLLCACISTYIQKAIYMHAPVNLNNLFQATFPQFLPSASFWVRSSRTIKFEHDYSAILITKTKFVNLLKFSLTLQRGMCWTVQLITASHYKGKHTKELYSIFHIPLLSAWSNT